MNGTFKVLEVPLVVDPGQERTLRVRFEAARLVYNAALREALRRQQLMRESRQYNAARKLEAGRARSAAFHEIRKHFGLQRYSLSYWAVAHISHSWLAQHVDSQTVQLLATRARRAVVEQSLGIRWRPGTKRRGEMRCLEGKRNNRQGIRFRGGRLIWGKLSLSAQMPVDDHAQATLDLPFDRVRLVRRPINGRIRYFAQLRFLQPPLPATQDVERTVVGIDPGPAAFGIATDRVGARVALGTSEAPARKRMRRIQRSIERKQLGSQGAPSRKLRQERQRYAETNRRLREQRRSMNGWLANLIVGLGAMVRIERNSFRAFQRRFGKLVRGGAPADLMRRVAIKVEQRGGTVTYLPTSLRLSQRCHGCGAIRPKRPNERVHACSCGVRVDRDVYSAWLTLSTMQRPSGHRSSGRVWDFDATRANAAWVSAGSRLPAASKTLSIAEFARLIEQSANGGTAASPHSGIEQFAGEVRTRLGDARDVVSDELRARESLVGSGRSRRHVATTTRAVEPRVPGVRLVGIIRSARGDADSASDRLPDSEPGWCEPARGHREETTAEREG